MRELPQPNRREFVRTIERLGIGATVLGAGRETAKGFFANDTIEIGCLGAGRRCHRLMQTVATLPNVRLAAVCDVADDHLNIARSLADKQAAAVKSYRQVLDRGDIDAVIIGSPDHWHVPMTVDSCAAGKDVYVEKPLSHNLDEGRLAIEAERRSNRIVQIGMQQRSMPHLQKARQLVRGGKIGKVFRVHLSWNRNAPRAKPAPLGISPQTVDWKAFVGAAPDQPFDEYRLRNWRWFWDFGGGLLTDLMVHWIDVVHWFLDSEHPERAATIGSHVASAGLWETPDTVQCLLDYPREKYQAFFEGTFSNARNRARVEFMGEEGTLYADRGRYEIHPEAERSGAKYEELVLGPDARRGLDFYDEPNGELLHLANWLECVRSRKAPNCPAATGVSAAAAAHLGNLSLRQSRLALWGG